MKRLIKKPIKALWKWTHPLRRPITRKIEAMISRSCVVQITMPAPAAAPVAPPVRDDSALIEETTVLMDHMIRELVRLQRRVESLHQAVEILSTNPQAIGLTVINELPRDAHRTRSVAG